MNKRQLAYCGALLLLLSCSLGLPASTPAVDLFATLQASTPLTVGPAEPSQTSTSEFPLDTPVAPSTPPPSSVSPGQPRGHIVFTCNIFKNQLSQICIINADGTGFRRLTTEDAVKYYYPFLAPDARSVVYAGYREPDIYELYEMDLATGNVTQLTDRLGNLNAPEISPDGGTIVFKFTKGASEVNQIWVMDRDGAHVAAIPGVAGWDPTWSPDGKTILFASDRDGTIQLYTVRVNGSDLHKVSSLPGIRGRSDWSPDARFVVTYSGAAWEREVYIMNPDGAAARRLSPPGGNSQGPSFSPDGKWVAFTAYFDHPRDENGCEIYIIRLDGTDLRRLTDNDHCDYQPRWGN